MEPALEGKNLQSFENLADPVRIIAIMLGRLEMDIDECIDAYTSMFQTIFATKGPPISILGNIKGRFDSAVFEKCIGKILNERGLSDTELFNDGKERCKVYDPTCYRLMFR